MSRISRTNGANDLTKRDWSRCPECGSRDVTITTVRQLRCIKCISCRANTTIIIIDRQEQTKPTQYTPSGLIRVED